MNKELEADTNLSHYRIVRKLGAGGMGEVFLAEDARLKRKVALKVLPENVASEKDRLLRFEREAFAASALNHPNILTIFEFAREGDTHFLASEFVTGETLRDRLERGRVGLSETLDIAVQIASALQAAHEAGIIHRDVKPENVMIREDGYVKVLDFGLAKLLEHTLLETDAETRRQLRTQAGVVMGTVAYMSPEQARGQPVDARADVWSLGCVLYELLTRRQPFQGETVTDVLANIIRQEPPSILTHRQDLPAELEHLIRKALRKNKDERYQSAKELLTDLKQLQMRLLVAAELERTSAPDSKAEAETQILKTAADELARTADTPTNSIAVLPFTNMSAEVKNALLVPGVDDKRAENLLPASVMLRHTVGREQERNELRAAFNAAKGGRGALLCIAGEPGIGKTTLVEDFLAELAKEPQCTIARGRCSERLAGTEAYLPLLEALESLLRDSTASSSEPSSMAATMKQLAPTWYAQVMPLSGDSDESARLLKEVKAASQERMKRELASFLTAVAEAQPLVIFFDDLHWADVSTIDLLSFLAGKFDALRVLIVVTYRPSDMLLAKHPFLQIKPDLQARGSCRELLLEFLTEAEIAEYLALELPRHAFPPDFARLIHAKTEGSPLFMADLVRYLRDRGVIAQNSGVWVLAQALPDIERELPESVRGMIERKLAQLSEDDRKLLTAASVQGYEFDSTVVAQVLNLDADEVEERLEKLERVFAFVKLTSEAEFPNRTLTLKYRFVHVLYQNALYASLRATRKATLSRGVAQTMEGFYGEQRTSVANQLATLYEAGREYARAADYYRLAAEHATRVAAYQEAVVLARRGLGLLKSEPDTTARTRQELALQITLSVPLGACRGLASQESRELFTRARELSQQLGDPPELWTIMVGQWRSYLVGGDNNTALKLGEEFLALVRAKAPAAMVWAHQMMVSGFNYRGEFTSACAHTKEMLAIWNPQPHYGEAVVYAGENPVMIGLFMGASSLWNLGYPEQALQQSREALALARQDASPFGLALATFLAAELHISRREHHRVRAMAEDCLAFCTEHGFPQWLANGYICRGWALVEAGQGAAGMAQMREGITAMHAFEADLARSRYLALLGEACGTTGQIAEGLSLLAEALAFAEQYGERFFEAEIYRLRGELLLKSEAYQAEVEECFHQAIKVAQRQQAKSLELRAMMSLARLWQQQGKREEARRMLSGIYGWFTEGFDTADLQEAKALLDELHTQAG
jgi:serine/threonine protein kinase/predicted ATPase